MADHLVELGIFVFDFEKMDVHYNVGKRNLAYYIRWNYDKRVLEARGVDEGEFAYSPITGVFASISTFYEQYAERLIEGILLQEEGLLISETDSK